VTPSSPPKEPSSIRVVSWNIHGSVGRDRRCDPDRILRHIHALQPDILALQEVDGRSHLGRRAGAFEFFADSLGDHLVEARLVRRPGRDYGHLLWSRWPIAGSSVRLLPFGRIEQRAAIDAVVTTPDSPLRLLSTHFGLSPIARRSQALALAALAEASSMPTVALGDFNEWRASGWVHRTLANVLPVNIRPLTWPSRRPFVPMDRLYASDHISIRRSATEASDASDHLPLVVDISLSAK
jgi:endonuclease/exonuclease/phosphatase family metal-dependent hydrolase